MKSLNLIFIAASTLCTLSAQLILKGVVGTPAIREAMTQGVQYFALAAIKDARAWIALSLQVLGYVIWLYVLSREKMAVAFAFSGSMFYILVALSAWIFYAERPNQAQWIGILFISVGVLLISRRS